MMKHLYDRTYLTFRTLLRGIGQVIFQNNALSGALMLVGIFINSYIMGIFALLGTIISTLTAKLLKYDEGKINDGLYGFNGTLIGIAIPCFFAINVWSILLMIVASALSTWVAHNFAKQKLLPGLTGPFVVITWIMLIMSIIFPVLRIVESVDPQISNNAFEPFKAFSLGFGQIMLQGNSLITGLLFLLGIAVNVPKMSLRATLACLLSLPLVWLPFIDTELINNGLYGYNAILAFLAITDIVSISSFKYLKAFVALLLSFIIQYLGMHIGITTLTAPFVLSVWIVVLIDKAGAKNNNI
ncbi:MAG: urea transporter [Fermentimonas sp.]|jgi:urea transporter